MKEEILSKLESLLDQEDIQSVKKEFKELSAQFKTLTQDVGKKDKSEDSDSKSTSDKEGQNSESAPDEGQSAKQEEQPSTENQDDASELKEELTEAETEAPAQETKAEPKSDKGAEKDVVDSHEPNQPDTSEQTSDSEEKATDSPEEIIKDSEGADKPGKPDEFKERFEKITLAFKERLKKLKEDKEKLEKETVAKAKVLLEDLKQIVENEENIGKSFAGFNTIKDAWKELPKVSNDSYRDLNAEYNKYVELFFYNINIYKELKDLDLKHNLEEKQRVLEDQKKLLETNDIRLLEVEVRLNQDRWNEIGPTYKEEWDKIKDEFWTITRAIYKRIQDFYNARKSEQNENLEKKQELLNRAKYLASLNLKSHKKWKEKTKEIVDLQKQWKMVGYVPKEDASEIWKEFRIVCDSFFDQKRKHYEELHAEQDANRDKKLKLVEEAEALKDSEDWKEASTKLTRMQREWKTMGAAHQRDENRLWRRFRDACDHFFQDRKGQRSEELEEQKQNQEAKEKLIRELKAFEPGDDRKVNVDALKEFSDRWRKIGHVPFKAKDAINKAYRDELDRKYGALKIDQKQKEQIRFEQKLADIKVGAQSSRVVQKEQDSIRAKISKIKSEITQFENNMGFFASSSKADKLKEEIELKIEKARKEIDVLKERLKLLRDAGD